VILVDINLLLYSHMDVFPQHEAARVWLDQRLNGATAIGLPWHSLLGFVRLATNPRLFAPAEPLEGAWRQVEDWLDCPRVWIPQPTDRHREILGSLLPHTGGQPNLVPDAHLAALALEHGLILCSTDGDFARFPYLRWENPLIRPA
jgi:toxin-antitoxin system PIN domain toxin